MKKGIAMDLKKKSFRMGTVLVVLFLIGGLILLYKGNDAIALAVEKKAGILTAEQVKVAFDSVGGRLTCEAVKEAQQVKKGDILMVLDSTDIDLSIAKLKAQIAQIDAQINALNGSIKIGYAKTDTNEKQSFRQIDQQREALNSARATYENKVLDYNRKVELATVGAIAQSELDNAQMNLNVAQANVAREEQALATLLAGVNDTGNTDELNLPLITQARNELDNKQYDVQSLAAQKQLLEVELNELIVNKERLTLRASEDGKILKVLAKEGEMVAPNAPVILLESKRCYYDIYLSEEQAVKLSEGDTVTASAVANKKEIEGTVRFITAAPSFADLKMTREKGQSDLSAFQVRIYTKEENDILPGMTVEVTADAFTKR